MAHFTDGTNDFTADKGLSRTTTPRGFNSWFWRWFSTEINRWYKSSSRDIWSKFYK